MKLGNLASRREIHFTHWLKGKKPLLSLSGNLMNSEYSISAFSVLEAFSVNMEAFSVNIEAFAV